MDYRTVSEGLHAEFAMECSDRRSHQRGGLRPPDSAGPGSRQPSALTHQAATLDDAVDGAADEL
jgi:hypothetical protein